MVVEYVKVVLKHEYLLINSLKAPFLKRSSEQ